MSEWEEVTLGEILQFQRGFDLLAKDRHDGNVPVISSSGITGYHNTAKAKSPGVIIGRKGTLGTVHYINIDYWPHDTTLWIKDFKGNLPKFIYYFLKVMRLENYDVGASNPTLNRNHLHKIRLKFPPLPVQKKIAAILSAYDDLIEKNNRRIAILEKMAEEIYREWFVRLRFPEHEQVKFNKGIPEGWKASKVGDACYVGDGTHSRIERTDKGVPYLTTKNFKPDGLDFYNIDYISFEEYKKQFESEKTSVKKPNHGDVLISIIGSFGRPYLVNIDDKFGISSSIAILRSDRNKILPEYLYAYTRTSVFIEAVHAIKSGSAQGFLSLEMIRSLPLLIPPISIQQQMYKFLQPILQSIRLLNNKTKILCQSRDRLLTRLISGKLSVEDLDIQFPPSMTEELE